MTVKAPAVKQRYKMEKIFFNLRDYNIFICFKENIIIYF